MSFLAQRGRTWTLSSHPVNTALANATTLERLVEMKSVDLAPEKDLTAMNDEIHLTPAVSCGVRVGPEEVMSSISSAVIDWIEDVAAADTRGEGYVNKQLEISEEIIEESHLSSLADEDAIGWSSDGLASPE